jgi:Transcription factor zinc-finger
MNREARCPACEQPMRAEQFERITGGELEIDICYTCSAIWFDRMESVQLAPGGVIALFKKIHEHRGDARHALPARLPCPRCREPLKLTNDIVKTGRVTYHRCTQNHGRYTTFLHFLREKKFVRDLTAGEIDTIRAQLAEVRCSGCGAPVDIKTQTACGYCRAPLSVLDADAVEKALREYAGEHQRRNDPARIAAALGEALVTQPMQARARDRAAAAAPGTDVAVATGDLLLSGIAALIRGMSD